MLVLIYRGVIITTSPTATKVSNAHIAAFKVESWYHNPITITYITQMGTGLRFDPMKLHMN